MPKRQLDECDLSAFSGAPIAAPEGLEDDSDCSLLTGECSEDGSLETEGSTETPDLPSSDVVYTGLKKKPSKKSVNFDDVTVYYFPRVQGFTCVPSQGGSTLGMGERHTSVEKYSLTDYASLRRSVHRDILMEHHREGKIILPENFEETSTEWTFDEYYFLQPVPARQRRTLLHEAGIAEIDPSERDECRTIRASRGRCGCTCRETCLAPTCTCHRSGIRCQVDQMSFPCACARDICANPFGRIEFNAARVRAHFVRTVLQMEMEKRQEVDATDGGVIGPPSPKRARITNDSVEPVHSDQIKTTSETTVTETVTETVIPNCELSQPPIDINEPAGNFEQEFNEYDGSDSSSDSGGSLENEVAEFSEHDMMVYDGRQSPSDGHFLAPDHRLVNSENTHGLHIHNGFVHPIPNASFVQTGSSESLTNHLVQPLCGNVSEMFCNAGASSLQQLGAYVSMNSGCAMESFGSGASATSSGEPSGGTVLKSPYDFVVRTPFFVDSIGRPTSAYSGLDHIGLTIPETAFLPMQSNESERFAGDLQCSSSGLPNISYDYSICSSAVDSTSIFCPVETNHRSSSYSDNLAPSGFVSGLSTGCQMDSRPVGDSYRGIVASLGRDVQPFVYECAVAENLTSVSVPGDGEASGLIGTVEESEPSAGRYGSSVEHIVDSIAQFVPSVPSTICDFEPDCLATTNSERAAVSVDQVVEVPVHQLDDVPESSVVAGLETFSTRTINSVVSGSEDATDDRHQSQSFTVSQTTDGDGPSSNELDIQHGLLVLPMPVQSATPEPEPVSRPSESSLNLFSSGCEPEGSGISAFSTKSSAAAVFSEIASEPADGFEHSSMCESEVLPTSVKFDAADEALQPTDICFQSSEVLPSECQETSVRQQIDAEDAKLPCVCAAAAVADDAVCEVDVMQAGPMPSPYDNQDTIARSEERFNANYCSHEMSADLETVEVGSQSQSSRREKMAEHTVMELEHIQSTCETPDFSVRGREQEQAISEPLLPPVMPSDFSRSVDQLASQREFNDISCACAVQHEIMYDSADNYTLDAELPITDTAINIEPGISEVVTEGNSDMNVLESSQKRYVSSAGNVDDSSVLRPFGGNCFVKEFTVVMPDNSNASEIPENSSGEVMSENISTGVVQGNTYSTVISENSDATVTLENLNSMVTTPEISDGRMMMENLSAVGSSSVESSEQVDLPPAPTSDSQTYDVIKSHNSEQVSSIFAGENIDVSATSSVMNGNTQESDDGGRHEFRSPCETTVNSSSSVETNIGDVSNPIAKIETRSHEVSSTDRLVQLEDRLCVEELPSDCV